MVADKTTHTVAPRGRPHSRHFALTHSPERKGRPTTGTTRQMVLPAFRPAGRPNCRACAYTTPTAPAFRFALFRVRPQAPSVNFSICRLHSALLVVRFHDNRRFLQEKRIFSCGRQHFASVKTPPFLLDDSGRSPRKPRAVARDRKGRRPRQKGPSPATERAASPNTTGKH